jgi:hypothetical protein
MWGLAKLLFILFGPVKGVFSSESATASFERWRGEARAPVGKPQDG